MLIHIYIYDRAGRCGRLFGTVSTMTPSPSASSPAPAPALSFFPCAVQIRDGTINRQICINRLLGRFIHIKNSIFDQLLPINLISVNSKPIYSQNNRTITPYISIIRSIYYLISVNMKPGTFDYSKSYNCQTKSNKYYFFSINRYFNR